MLFLLDTHALLWWLADSPALPDSARERIANPDHDVYVSAVTAWEIAIKRELGKLRAPFELAGMIKEEGFSELPISLQHGENAGRLPPIHRDPFDRMLVAQAATHNMIILTRDESIARYGIKTAW
ncbi:MAG: type II toxin-antitoxin system VapC family toxin [Wenzhouxiangella sp.]